MEPRAAPGAPSLPPTPHMCCPLEGEVARADKFLPPRWNLVLSGAVEPEEACPAPSEAIEDVV